MIYFFLVGWGKNELFYEKHPKSPKKNKNFKSPKKNKKTKKKQKKTKKTKKTKKNKKNKKTKKNKKKQKKTKIPHHMKTTSRIAATNKVTETEAAMIIQVIRNCLYCCVISGEQQFWSVL